MLALIKRHVNLFGLPTRIRHATERGLYDQVMRAASPFQVSEQCKRMLWRVSTSSYLLAYHDVMRSVLAHAACLALKDRPG